MLGTTLAVFTVDCLQDYYEKGQSKYFFRKFVLGKLVTQLLTKKNDPLYIIQCSYQVLRYSIVNIDENYQAAIIFNSLDI